MALRFLLGLPVSVLLPVAASNLGLRVGVTEKKNYFVNNHARANVTKIIYERNLRREVISDIGLSLLVILKYDCRISVSLGQFRNFELSYLPIVKVKKFNIPDTYWLVLGGEP